MSITSSKRVWARRLAPDRARLRAQSIRVLRCLALFVPHDILRPPAARCDFLEDEPLCDELERRLYAPPRRPGR